MIAAAEYDGGTRYALPQTWSLRGTEDRLIFSIFPACRDDPATQGYLDLIDDAIGTPDGRFLYRPALGDLIDRQARIITVHAGRIQPDALVAARYTHMDTDALRFRGGIVRGSMRGRALSAAMGSIALYDGLRRNRGFGAVVASVIVQDGVPNRASVRALAKLGFCLTDQEHLTEILGTDRDRHLRAYAECLDGRPVIRRRALRLDEDSLPGALRFLATWRG